MAVTDSPANYCPIHDLFDCWLHGVTDTNPALAAMARTTLAELAELPVVATAEPEVVSPQFGPGLVLHLEGNAFEADLIATWARAAGDADAETLTRDAARADEAAALARMVYGEADAE